MDSRNNQTELINPETAGTQSEQSPGQPGGWQSFINKILTHLQGYYLTVKGWFVNKKMSRKDKWAIAICFLMSVTVWLYVMSTNDTGYENSLSYVTVNILGKDTLKNNDLSIISGFDNIVTVTLKGKRADIGGLTPNEINAYIDVSEITASGQYPLPVKIEVPENSTLVSVEPSAVSVNVDVNSERVIKIEVMLEYVIDAAYTLGEMLPNYTSVTVTGPKSILDTIAYAAVKSDVGTIKTSQKLSGKVALYDVYNQEINNPYLKCSVNEVSVTVPVTMRKTVPLVIDFVGGYSTQYDRTISPAEVTLIGDPLIVSKIEQISVFTVNNNDFIVGEQKAMHIDILELPEGVVVSESYKGVNIIIERLY